MIYTKERAVQAKGSILKRNNAARPRVGKEFLQLQRVELMQRA